MIERKAKVTVNEWITHGNDAFLLTGARQIGKTYLIRQCLKESGYPYIEFNFIEQPELVNLFAGAKDAKELLMRLSVVATETLEQGKTIIFLDEIQEFKDIVTRIKFLVEDGTFRYIMSGSLLGVELNDLRSAPVGYLEIYDMYPLDFKEFVRAAGLKNDVILMLEDHFKKRNPVDDFIHSKMLDLFYLYLIVGGMPEAVAVYLETNDLAKVAKVHEKIIRLYKTDFSKYEKNYKLKLQEIYDAMPGQLDQKNKRFQLNAIEKGMSYDRLKNEFHHEDAGQSFHMIKKEDCEIPPEIFRKILFLLMILTKACRQILGKYAVSVTMETASEKFFVVRFSCDYSQNLDKNGQIIYTGENQECHKDIMDLTEKITDSIVYRTVSLEKENRYILNCAIERRNHRVDS